MEEKASTASVSNLCAELCRIWGLLSEGSNHATPAESETFVKNKDKDTQK